MSDERLTFINGKVACKGDLKCKNKVVTITKSNIWDKVFKNGPSKICRRQPLKNFEGVWSAYLDHS